MSARAASPSNATNGAKPNIILIMCDDAGFADFGYTGGVADTPVLDKLAAGGMRFTRAYSNARCMPTRASLMTGLNPQQSGEGPLNGNCVTIAEVLKEAGYASTTGGFSGSASSRIEHPAMETPASSFKLRASAPESRKRFPSISICLLGTALALDGGFAQEMEFDLPVKRL